MGTIVLVTGANGFVGGNLIRLLSQSPEIMVLATDLQEDFHPAPGTEVNHVEYIAGNLTDPGFTSSLFHGRSFKAVIHLAGLLTKRDDAETHVRVLDANVKSTALLLDAIPSAQTRFILASTGLVYGEQNTPFTEDMEVRPNTFYALSKLMAENTVLYKHYSNGLPYVVFRPGILYGPGQRGTMFIPSIIDAVLTKSEFPMTEGNQLRDFVYVGDFTDALFRAIYSSEIGIFNIGTSSARPMREVAELVENIAGVENLVHPGALPYRSHEVWQYCLDASAARKMFGWNARVSLEDGLRRTFTAARQNRKPQHV